METLLTCVVVFPPFPLFLCAASREGMWKEAAPEPATPLAASPWLPKPSREKVEGGGVQSASLTKQAEGFHDLVLDSFLMIT